MTTRRGFLKGAGLILVAPAIVKAENLMKIFVPKQEIILPVYSRSMTTPYPGYWDITQEQIDKVAESAKQFVESDRLIQIDKWFENERKQSNILLQRHQAFSRGFLPIFSTKSS